MGRQDIHPLLVHYKAGYRMGATIGLLFGTGLLGILLYVRLYVYLWFPLVFIVLGVVYAINGPKWLRAASAVLRGMPREMLVTLRYEIERHGGHQPRTRVRWQAVLHPLGVSPDSPPLTEIRLASVGNAQVDTADIRVDRHGLAHVKTMGKEISGPAWTKPGKVYCDPSQPGPVVMVIGDTVLLSLGPERLQLPPAVSPASQQEA